MKKLLAVLLAVMMTLSIAPAMAEESKDPRPDWTEYDQLIDDIKSTTDFVEREAMMHRAEDILMDTGAIVPIYYYNDLYMMKPTVEGFYANVYGTKYFTYCTNGDSDTLRINLASEPDYIDPALNSSVDGATLAAAAFGGLYTYDADGALAPNFATGYTASEDGLTYTFTIREGLKWSNGEKLDANDFIYSWNRAINPDTAADYEYMFDIIDGYADGKLNATASEDGLTLTVVLSKPCSYFLDLVAFPTYYPVYEEAVENAEGYKDADGNVVTPNAWALNAGDSYVTCGPFMLTEWVHDEHMVYTKNPNYWDADNVKIEKLEFMLSADDTAIYAAYNAGDLDFIDTVPTDEIANLRDNPEFYIIPNLGTYYVIFNVKSPMFDGYTAEQASTYRKALSMLIDRQYIIDTVAQCDQTIATAFIPVGMADGNGGEFRANDDAFTNPLGDGYFSTEVDIDGAVELLKSIGFEFDENNMLSASTPININYITNTATSHQAIAECIQMDFAQIGINMTISTEDWNVFLQDRKAGNYDVARNGWLADFNDPINMLEMWTTKSGNNDAQFGRQ